MGLPSPVPMRKDKKIIPKDELMFWLENNVDTEGLKIIKIRDAHLWTQGDYERHRLDVFEKYEVEGEGEFRKLNSVQRGGKPFQDFKIHYIPKSNTYEVA